MPKLQKKYRDLASRAAWTALQAGLGLITVEVLDIPVGWVVPVAWALSSVKSWVATKVGNSETVTFVEEPPRPPVLASRVTGGQVPLARREGEPGRSTFGRREGI